STGPLVQVGEVCRIRRTDQSWVLAEVVGFRDDSVLLMPLGGADGLAPGSLVEATGRPLQVAVGEDLLGRVLDGLGNVLDEGEPILSRTFYPLMAEPPHPLTRPRIDQVLSTGVRAIDSLLTVGIGQRLGIFAGSGVGKSTLLGMIARNSQADVNVIGLIGERGREVREFIERDLGPEGMARSVVVVATSDQPALVRLKGAFVATAIAEYFRDQGQNVMLMVDSLTRFAMAQREVGLSIGEPPTSRGYTPSVFSLLPRLLERSGRAEEGSITAFYTVLVDGDDMNEPITDAVRGILDGHIVLSRDLANRGHYPAIDPLASISRLFMELASPEQREAANRARRLLAVYRENQDLINIGAYKAGGNPEIDEAIERLPAINGVLQQVAMEKDNYQQAVAALLQAVGR
ncbi:MAG: flagellar protein export ATPase FliI, partial [Firmicutes bacterium]|nr:flagellar protein export ATPase FliI [Bacillota bacterium]